MGFVASVCQPSTLRMLVWPEASSAQNSMAAVRWQHGLRFDPSLELFVQPFDCVCCTHCAIGSAAVGLSLGVEFSLIVLPHVGMLPGSG